MTTFTDTGDQDDVQPGGEVLAVRWMAVAFAVGGLLALLVGQGRWGLAGLLTAALALGFAEAAAWADRRTSSR